MQLRSLFRCSSVMVRMFAWCRGVIFTLLVHHLTALRLVVAHFVLRLEGLLFFFLFVYKYKVGVRLLGRSFILLVLRFHKFLVIFKGDLTLSLTIILHLQLCLAHLFLINGISNIVMIVIRNRTKLRIEILVQVFVS
jgi:hypothetical protein